MVPNLSQPKMYWNSNILLGIFPTSLFAAEYSTRNGSLALAGVSSSTGLKILTSLTALIINIAFPRAHISDCIVIPSHGYFGGGRPSGLVSVLHSSVIWSLQAKYLSLPVIIKRNSGLQFIGL
jgi:hypothetical protein